MSDLNKTGEFQYFSITGDDGLISMRLQPNDINNQDIVCQISS